VPDARSSFLDGGGVGLDGRGGADVKPVVATANRGCTCALGQASSAQSGSVLLLGAIALLVRRTARRRR
jgi:MYXO-CTERM domain-containing protein